MRRLLDIKRRGQEPHACDQVIAVEGLVALAVCALIWPELRRPPELPTELRE